MRLLRVDGGRTAILIGSGEDARALDVGASLEALDAKDAAAAAMLRKELPDPTGSWRGLIEAWSEAGLALAVLERLGEEGGGVSSPLQSVSLEPPLPAGAAGKVLAIGANFACHLARVQSAFRGETITEEQAKTLFPSPWGFHILTDTVIGDGAAIFPPAGSELLDYEAEVGAVLALGGRDLAPEDVRFWGVAPYNDFSLRDPHLGRGDRPFDIGPLNWALQKTFETGTAMGPFVQVLPEPGPVPNLRITLRVNGEERQSEWTEKMLYSFADVAAHLSHFIRLNPGDVIASGTPKGTALEDGVDGKFLRPGDVVETEVEGVGVLTNFVGAW